MNVKEIKEMITLMNENGLTELEIEKDGLKLRLRKSNGGITSEFTVAPVPHVVTAAPPQPAAAPAKEADAASRGLVEIKSPMVGTFYRAPAPDAPPYIQEGQNVEIGQVVCIVEAMKLMNEIKSEVRGKVTRIMVDNADPVEFGQAMFLIEPSK
jgi:acetyl-CoA carboxylase biotin carboxyl carrier protein